jgi:hypothetical protein
LQHDADGLGDGAARLGGADAVDELHRDERRILADLVDRGDVGMRKTGGEVGFSAKSRKILGVADF